MKTFFKRHVGLIIFLIIVLVFPTSLSNQAKLNMRMIVTGLAIDKVGEDYEVTAQIVKATPGTESPGTSATIDFVSDSSKTLADAMSKITYKSGKVSAFSHISFVILGEGIREEKATKCLDYFIRDKIVKASTMVAFAEGKAGDEIKKTKNIDLSVGLGIQKTFLYKEYESDGIMTTILDFVNKSTSYGKCAVASVIKLSSEQSSQQNESSGSGSQSETSSSNSSNSSESEFFESRAPLMCFSAGMFKGKLESEEEIFGYMMSNPRVKAGDFVVEKIETDTFKNAKATIFIKDKMNFKKVRYENGKPRIDLTVVINNAEIVEVLSDESVLRISPEEYKSVEKAFQKELSKEIGICFEKAKEMGVDIFNAYETAYKFNYKETNKRYKNVDNFISDLKLNVNVLVQKLDY